MKDNMLIERLNNMGFSLFSREETGLFFHDFAQKTCLIIDQNVCQMKNYPYVEYTHTQNRLVQNYDRVFRFLHEDKDEQDMLFVEIAIFLNEEDPDPEKIKHSGRNRKTRVSGLYGLLL
ncbi:MAG: hypothetical protein JW786_10085 [Desulfobacterales bacterium]|nr:hypothetical protein [Desulfobacterales bacterium]